MALITDFWMKQEIFFLKHTFLNIGLRDKNLSDLVATLILFAAGVIAAFINVNAGGGSSLTLPLLIFLGLDSATANGTNRIAVLTQNVAAVFSFRRENHSHFSLSTKLSLLTLPGAIAGTFIAINISDDLFQKILAVILILLIIPMFTPSKKNAGNEKVDEKITLPITLAMFVIGFYGGFLQVGVGFMIMAFFRYMMRFSLVWINVHKVFIVLFFTLPSFLIFLINGNVDWKYGLSLAAGNTLGGWWAAKISVKKGEGFIKIFLVAALIIISL